jgi:hypothetical protein
VCLKGSKKEKSLLKEKDFILKIIPPDHFPKGRRRRRRKRAA